MALNGCFPFGYVAITIVYWIINVYRYFILIFHVLLGTGNSTNTIFIATYVIYNDKFIIQIKAYRAACPWTVRPIKIKADIQLVICNYFFAYVFSK